MHDSHRNVQHKVIPRPGDLIVYMGGLLPVPNCVCFVISVFSDHGLADHKAWRVTMIRNKTNGPVIVTALLHAATLGATWRRLNYDNVEAF